MIRSRLSPGSRWSSIPAGILVGLLGVWALPHSIVGAEPAAPRPHIVVLIADDLGWADVGYHGSRISTPHIDRLAEEGVRLESHYVLPTCTPTRVGLVSGRYPSRFGVLSPAYGQVLPDDLVTLPKALREAGYSTHLSGKWHMGSPPEFVPRRYGFDTSYGYFHGQIDPYTHHYKDGERSWHRNDELLDEEGHATDLITREAIRVIEAEHTRPFFLYVAYSVPHFPLREPDRWTEPYRDVYDAPSRQWYAGSVTHMDDGIGKILAAIDARGLREKTLVVFTSDNGGQRSWSSKSQYGGDYADLPHTVLGDNRPLRGWKGDVYEGGMRVPAVARWPGVLKPSGVESPIHIVDWMPTLCALAGWTPKDELRWDGRDVWDVVRGATKGAPRTLYWRTPQARALRHGDWKLVAPDGDRRPELYQLAEDPFETRDLASSSPERLAELQKLLGEVSSRDRGRAGEEPAFRFEPVSDDSLGLWEGDRPVFVYNHGMIEREGVPDSFYRSGYIHPLYGIEGEVLTDDFPKDHYHHRGLFWGWPHVLVDGKEYQSWVPPTVLIRLEAWKRREARKDRALLVLENGWYTEKGKIVSEDLTITVHRSTGTSRAIDLDFTWTACEKPVTLRGAEGKSYGGLTLRFAPREDPLISVPSGRTKEDLTIAKLAWADYTGKFEGASERSGAAIFIAQDHPDYPPEWLTRHYGCLCVGWPGVEPGTLEPGKPVRCRYRVWVHRGEPSVDELAAAYASYTKP